MKMKKFLAAAMVVASLTTASLATPAHALETPVSQTEKFIRTAGDAVVRVKADGAILSIQVEGTAKQLNDAKAKENSKRAALLKELAKVGIDETDVETTYFATREQREEVKGKNVRVGYIAQETLNVTVADAKKLPDVLDVPSLSGDLLIQGVSWTYSKSDELYEQLLDKAVKQAEKKAKRLAAPLQANALKLVNIEEVTTAPQGTFGYGKSEVLDTRSNLQPEDITVYAGVRVTFSY